MAATKEDIARLEKSLSDLLQLNTTLSTQVTALQKENSDMKRAAQSTLDRINENKEKWQQSEGEVVQLIQQLSTVKQQLEEDKVERAFFQENCDSYKAISPSVSFISL